MAWVVLLAVIAIPVVEIALFIKSSQWVGLLPTIIIAIGAGALGIALVRRQGVELLLRARTQLDMGEMPVREVFDGICLAMAGILLLLPGFFTDIVAILLLLPPVRAALRLWLSRHTTVTTTHTGNRHPAGPQVIEAEYHVIEDHDAPKS
ncbi:MAG: FxsA family protein [Rhodospirillaceae bacterium]|nr:FxsA family protein [Rhodospirillales bacterium]